MRIPFGQPQIGEEEQRAVASVLDGSILVHGTVTAQFEEAFSSYTGAPYCVSVSSCTAGMHLVYFAIGLTHGDEVIVPAQTHVATAHAVELTGAKAVFVDSEETTGNIDIAAIERAITPKTRAIAVVHYLGVPVDMAAILEIAKPHGLFVLEDCALAIGSKRNGAHVGLHGDVGVFSFYPVKHITTAEGGMIVLKDSALADRLRLLKAFGVDRTHSERKVAGQYDSVALGFNYRMSEVHAAIGVEQLKKLPRFLEKRSENFSALRELLSSQSRFTVLPQPSAHNMQSSYYCMGLLLDDRLKPNRVKIMAEMSNNNVGTSIYYPQPVPAMSYYKKKYGYRPEDYSNSQNISDSVIALSVGPHLGLTEMEETARQLSLAIENNS